MGEEVKAGPVVPESVLKKRKREEQWALAKKQGLESAKKKNSENRKLIYNRAKQYAKEYDEQVHIQYPNFEYCSIFFLSVLNLDLWISIGLWWFGFPELICQQKELISLKREAKLKGGFYVNPEAKLLFIVRIRGYACFLWHWLWILPLGVSLVWVFVDYDFSLVGFFLTFRINAIDPKTKKILQLLRLRQVTPQLKFHFSEMGN